MERDAFKAMERWHEGTPRKPLMLMGARQVGKTWLMEAFAERHYPGRWVRVDLQRNERLRNLIEESGPDPRAIVDWVQATTGRAVREGETLLAIDEIQESPKALTALKYFNEAMPGLAVMAAGSLLGVAVGKSRGRATAGMPSGRGSFPVGKVAFLDICPMSFAEFLRAVGKAVLADAAVRGDWKLLEGMGTECTELYRKYLFAGGMPEAVGAFADTGDYTAVRNIQDDLLRAYDADFAKHAPPAMLPKIRLLWRNIPAQLAKENRKFVYAAMKNGARAREYEDALRWLDDAGMIHQVYRVSPPALPPGAHRDFSAFKLYLHDVGLLGAMAGIDARTLLEGNALFTNFKGAMTEQFVLQELVAAGLEPDYWSADAGNAEVEFIVPGGGGMIPIEAKAGLNTKAKSLKVFRERFHPPLAIRTSLQPRHDGGDLQDIPLYAIGAWIPALLAGTP